MCDSASVWRILDCKLAGTPNLLKRDRKREERTKSVRTHVREKRGRGRDEEKGGSGIIECKCREGTGRRARQ